MTAKNAVLPVTVHAYMVESTLREAPLLSELRAYTAGMPGARMQIGPEQGQFMALLAHAIGARRYLEIGVYTGYSALAVALALPPDGKVVACDIDAEYPAIGQRYWERAGVADCIELHVGPAMTTLDRLIAAGSEPFDMAFIDADKANVDGYYERSLRLVRTNGLILVDNVLWGGTVIDPAVQDVDTRALRTFNEKIGRDERVDVTMLALCDGLTVARKRAADGERTNS
ncbi:MAG: class I SAM-dependent methyltransferase [Vulcanimicrobiaceae bacterium]